MLIHLYELAINRLTLVVLAKVLLKSASLFSSEAIKIKYPRQKNSFKLPYKPHLANSTFQAINRLK